MTVGTVSPCARRSATTTAASNARVLRRLAPILSFEAAPRHRLLMTTPMMQQYREAKERHPGMLLLFRMGDFYELFHDDAEVAARVLGLTLTSRDSQIPMAGFPHRALETHLRTLLRAGLRVAVCDQVED